MKKVINSMFLTAFLVFAVTCKSSTPKDISHSEVKNDKAKLYYTCSMHPEIHSDKPGNCPKCGMELVMKYITKSDSTHMHHQSDSID
jgi:hypothetical protein